MTLPDVGLLLVVVVFVGLACFNMGFILGAYRGPPDDPEAA